MLIINNETPTMQFKGKVKVVTMKKSNVKYHQEHA